MDTNAALEVLIGLAAMYLLLALLCTIINEIVATVFELRAKSLREGIGRILNDENFSALAKDIFATQTLKSATAVPSKYGPSYLPSRQFASAVLEYIGSGKLDLGPGLTNADLKQAVDALAKSTLTSPFAALAREVGGDVEKLRERIAEWYDDAMERWGGVYKRNMQKLSLAVAAAIVVALNADTFEVGKRLWDDPVLRAEALVLAGPLDPTDPSLVSYAAVKEKLRPFPLGWPLSGSAAETPPPAQTVSTQSQVAAATATAATGAQAPATDAGMTVGPDAGTADAAPSNGSEAGADRPHWFVALVLKILGLAFSALAVALGAPFWFEVLNKLNAIRGAGRKPAPATPTS